MWIDRTMDIKLCECGCGEPAGSGYWSRTEGRFRKQYHRFKKGHNMFGVKRLPEVKEKWTGQNHGNWKGDDVSYSGLHYRIRKLLPQQKLCQVCTVKSPREIACIGDYNMDFKNWLRVCKSCHNRIDNTAEHLRRYRTNKKKQEQGY